MLVLDFRLTLIVSVFCEQKRTFLVVGIKMDDTVNETVFIP